MSETITIYCKNNNTYKEVPIGSSLLDIYSLVGAPLRLRPMNAQVNNKTEGLTFRCWHPKDVEYVDYTQLSGMRTYVRSLCHIFSKAVNDVLPSATLNLEHPISKGYYCVIHNGKDIDEETIGKIKKRMREIIDADLPFHLKTIRTIDAAVLFRERGMNDKARLIESAGMPYTSYYELDGYINYFYGCLTPSTGYIQDFDLVPYFDGVLLRVPQRTNPTELEPVIRQDKMFQVYKEHLTLQRTVGLDNVGDLNRAIEKGMTSEVVMVSEAMQEKQVAKIAEEIAARYDNGVRIVLISGPSSSGKTTFCKRLQVQLITNLIHPVGLSLDDYFLNREDTPKDESGEYDFESLYALDLPYFNSELQKLLSGEEIEVPSFNFETGRRVFKGKKDEDEEYRLRYITGGMLSTAELSILQARKEITLFAERTGRMLDMVKALFYEKNEDAFLKTYSRVEKYESISDRMEIEIANYLTCVAEGRLSSEGKEEIRIMLRAVSEIESIADSCNNMARSIKRRNEFKSIFTDEQNHNVDQMLALTEKALHRMIEILKKSELVRDDVNPSYNIENEINNYRNQLKIHNVEDINNKKYQYQDGVYYMDIIGEAEKLGDYVLNVVQAVIEKKI